MNWRYTWLTKLSTQSQKIKDLVQRKAFDTELKDKTGNYKTKKSKVKLKRGKKLLI